MNISTKVLDKAAQGLTDQPRLFSPGNTLPFILVTALFLFWGIPSNMNDILIKQSMKSFEITRFEAGLIQSAFHMGYILQAVEWTGMEHVPIEDRTRFLSDRGPGFLARVLEDYLRMLEIRHIYCSPYPPQTNGKLERFHEPLKARLDLLVFTSPEALRAAMAEFMEFYSYHRYHEGIGNVTPAGVYYVLTGRNSQKEEGTKVGHH